MSDNLKIIEETAKENRRLRAEIERLRAAVAYVRMRSRHACSVLNEFDNTRRALELKP